MKNFFSRQKKRVTEFLDVFLGEAEGSFSSINRWGLDAVQRLSPFLTSGKMMRSGLVCLGYRICRGRVSARVLPAAAAVELIQTSLLIHDDIIDRDSYRRGIPSLFYQYSLFGEKSGVSDPQHFGEGMGICLGDIGFFLAFELLSGLAAAKAVREKIIRLWARELCFVGLAQMQDLYYGEQSEEVSEKEILHLYDYKTARYSFSIPMMTGALLGDAAPGLLAELEACGETLGLLFQLKDDELGLFGTEEELGKPIGSDIRENKKTLHHFHLSRRVNPADRERLETIWGNKALRAEMVGEVLEMTKKYSVRKTVRDTMEDLYGKAHRQISGLDIGESDRRLFFDLLDFSLNRTN